MGRYRAFRAARCSYQLAQLRAVACAVALATVPFTIALATTDLNLASGALAVTLGSTIAFCTWTGGPYRRGARLGLFAGLPMLVAPAVVLSLTSNHCTRCNSGGASLCLAVCFGTSALVGIGVAHRADHDVAPRSFASSALVVAGLIGFLGCGVAGLGGAFAIGLGAVLGAFVGLTVAARELEQ